ncbi:nucleoid-associated protein [Burkholderia pseudomallei]|nr:nucleoid-associated protein [Burkholderia pseudomallei]
MLDISSARIVHCVVHRVGNRLREEGCELSSQEVRGTAELHGTLLKHYLAPLAKGADEFDFYHESDIALNAVRQFSSRIFENPDNFLRLSQNIAKHLYSASSHPSITGGEFIEILFHDIRVDGESRLAIGVYKIEQREPFLEVEKSGDALNLIELSGIPVSNIQKGALIIDSDFHLYAKESGGQQAKYWVDSFLKARPRQTEKSTAKVAAEFVKQVCSRIDVDAGVALRRDLVDVFSKNETLLYKDIEDTSRQYLDSEEIERLTNQLEEQSGFHSLQKSPVESALLMKQARNTLRRYPLAHGVGITIENPNAHLEKCVVSKTKNGYKAIIDINIAGA